MICIQLIFNINPITLLLLEKRQHNKSNFGKFEQKKNRIINVCILNLKSIRYKKCFDNTRTMKQTLISILASGNGTNAQQIAEYFKGRNDIVVDSIIYNKKDAYVATRAKNLGIESFYMNRRDFMESNKVLDLLQSRKVDYVILAGFLLLVPENILNAYPNKIINIHPALLPNYGGKGMYGHHVHEAVVANHETVTGITIHVVDHRYDCGTTLFQARCVVLPTDTADDVAARIHLLEKEYFPAVIDAYISSKPMPKQNKILCE